MTNSFVFNDTIILKMFANKRGVRLHRLVLVSKGEPGVLLDLSSSDLPEEVQKIVQKKSSKKVLLHSKTEVVPANYVVKIMTRTKHN